MIPLSVILGLVLACGAAPALDDLRGGPTDPPLPVSITLLAVGLSLALVAAVSALAGAVLVRRQQDDGHRARSQPWRSLARTSLILDAVNLVTYTVVLFGLGWNGVVSNGLGLGSSILLDELLTFAPFLIGQILVWAALVPAERQLYPADSAPGRRTFTASLLRRSRAGFGLVLPGVLLYALVADLVARSSPLLSADPTGQVASIVGVAGVAILILIGAPIFVRSAWPSTRLPEGPLRTRLETLAHRLGFRYTDILVWDTDGHVLNAGITGTLPFFRYVLLSDRLVEQMDPSHIEAVFGHEVGHVAHRHLNFFGLFFLGTIGLMALLGQGFDAVLGSLPLSWTIHLNTSLWGELIEWGVVILSLLWLAAFVFVVFGHLSRRFERQADVYGCRATSCGDPDCQPEHDHRLTSGPLDPKQPLCPASIRIFSETLWEVAILNGIDPEASSWRQWRHGSIQSRIDFLSRLDGRPDVERRFQRRVRQLRLVLGAGMLVGMIAAAATGALAHI